MSLLPLHDRDGYIWTNGALVPWRDANVHVLSHGLHYASAVFDGVRIYDGIPFKLGEHCQRLIDSAAMIGLQVLYSASELVDGALRAVAANNVANGYMRPVAWRGSEQLEIGGLLTTSHVAIACWEYGAYFSAADEDRGLRLSWSKWRRPSPDAAPYAAKAAGLYVICTMAKREAEAAGYDDAVMLDQQGALAEVTAANIFLVRDGVLLTPKPDCFLDGITRQTVIELAPTLGLRVEQRKIFPEELAQADEVFVTGTAAEIVPVSELGGHHWPVGPVTRRIRSAYRELVRSGSHPAVIAA